MNTAATTQDGAKALPKGIEGFIALHPLPTDSTTLDEELNRYTWILYDRNGKPSKRGILKGNFPHDDSPSSCNDFLSVFLALENCTVWRSPYYVVAYDVQAAQEFMKEIVAKNEDCAAKWSNLNVYSLNTVGFCSMVDPEAYKVMPLVRTHQTIYGNDDSRYGDDQEHAAELVGECFFWLASKYQNDLLFRKFIGNPRKRRGSEATWDTITAEVFDSEAVLREEKRRTSCWTWKLMTGKTVNKFLEAELLEKL